MFRDDMEQFSRASLLLSTNSKYKIVLTRLTKQNIDVLLIKPNLKTYFSPSSIATAPIIIYIFPSSTYFGKLTARFEKKSGASLKQRTLIKGEK